MATTATPPATAPAMIAVLLELVLLVLELTEVVMTWGTVLVT